METRSRSLAKRLRMGLILVRRDSAVFICSGWTKKWLAELLLQFDLVIAAHDSFVIEAEQQL